MKKVAFRLGLAVAALALALPMMAKTDNAAKPKSATLTIDSPVKFGDSMVKPGTYKIVIENEKASIENGKNVIASANGRWEDRKQKADSTGFETTNGQVDTIFLHGDTNAFVLSGGQVSQK